MNMIQLRRRQTSHVNVWRAVVKSPLILFHFLAPFFFGVLVSPMFTSPAADVPWLGAGVVLAAVSLLVYLNGVFASFFLGFPLFYFLNAVRFQNRWVYLLAGFAGGTVANFFYPWYVTFLSEGGPYPAIADTPVAQLAVSSYPILFGLCGLAVAHSFWKILTKDAAPAA
jgi:hypothetical protein